MERDVKGKSGWTILKIKSSGGEKGGATHLVAVVHMTRRTARNTELSWLNVVTIVAVIMS